MTKKPKSSVSRNQRESKENYFLVRKGLNLRKEDDLLAGAGVDGGVGCGKTGDGGRGGVVDMSADG